MKMQGVIFADFVSADYRGLAELGSDLTGKYIIERIASQVTVLKIYHTVGGTGKSVRGARGAGRFEEQSYI